METPTFTYEPRVLILLVLVWNLREDGSAAWREDDRLRKDFDSGPYADLKGYIFLYQAHDPYTLNGVIVVYSVTWRQLYGSCGPEASRRPIASAQACHELTEQVSRPIDRYRDHFKIPSKYMTDVATVLEKRRWDHNIVIN